MGACHDIEPSSTIDLIRLKTCIRISVVERLNDESQNVMYLTGKEMDYDPHDISSIVKRLVHEYRERCSLEGLSWENFLAEHPQHASLLNQHFPTLPSEFMFDEDTHLDTVIHADIESDTAAVESTRLPSSAATGTLVVGEKFGRYQIISILGQGAMGAVYLALDTQLDRKVALKTPKLDTEVQLNPRDVMERFYREAKAAATLRSPFICPVYDVGEIDGQHYITMAYIDGSPLSNFLTREERLSEKEIAVTICKLALGLEEAHRIGVIHRDLKPGNIMIDHKGEPVVMDFGLARRCGDVKMTPRGAILGTPSYIAPEQVSASYRQAGPQSDIYALGVIMYQLITGQLPYRGSLLSVIQQISKIAPQRPSSLRDGLSARLEMVCNRMMARRLEDRYQSMSEVVTDLHQFLFEKTSSFATPNVTCSLLSFARTECDTRSTQLPIFIKHKSVLVAIIAIVLLVTVLLNFTI